MTKLIYLYVDDVRRPQQELEQYACDFSVTPPTIMALDQTTSEVVEMELIHINNTEEACEWVRANGLPAIADLDYYMTETNRSGQWKYNDIRPLMDMIRVEYLRNSPAPGDCYVKCHSSDDIAANSVNRFLTGIADDPDQFTERKYRVLTQAEVNIIREEQQNAH